VGDDGEHQKLAAPGEDGRRPHLRQGFRQQRAIGEPAKASTSGANGYDGALSRGVA